MGSEAHAVETSFRLDGKSAVVTGATRGIGRAIAEALAAAGATLILTARSDRDLAELAADLAEAYGARARTVACDLRDSSAVEGLAERAWSLGDGVDVLVNNAGVSHPQPVVDVDSLLWDEVMEVNLRAPALLASRVGRAMAEAGNGGSIINVASAAGQRALPEHYAYCTSKAGLIMATKVLALELGPHGVRANVVCPTIVMTEMGQRVWGEEKKAAPMLARIPSGRFVEPSEVADAVVFLASPASSMINGVELAIDGGYGIS